MCLGPPVQHQVLPDLSLHGIKGKGVLIPHQMNLKDHSINLNRKPEYRIDQIMSMGINTRLRFSVIMKGNPLFLIRNRQSEIRFHPDPIARMFEHLPSQKTLFVTCLMNYIAVTMSFNEKEEVTTCSLIEKDHKFPMIPLLLSRRRTRN
jgi:hypothetical protein